MSKVTISLPIHPIIMEDVQAITSNAIIHWNQLKSKTVLITGASGLIGSYLVYTLLCLNETKEMGVKVLALVRNREKAEKQFAGIIDRNDFSLIVQDVVTPVMHPDTIEYIIHTASQTSPKGMMSDPVGTITANAVGTLNMLELSRKKMLFSSIFLPEKSMEIVTKIKQLYLKLSMGFSIIL